ncbi:tetratricopeptide repeat protein, partial [Akkermansiaceae bacterium]|nr:tetratricopeptide repeat protein [Akkermansiaceae bacterium]
STFRDFGEERDLLVKKVFPELRRMCRQRQVELVDVDLRWGITAEEAEQGKVLPICLAEIDRARPYFMGFIGERYGWVPEESEYPEVVVEREPWLKQHQGGKSVTELEMLHGVLNNPQMAGRAFFYFRDKDYSLSKGGDYEPESPQHAAKLDQLRDRLRQSEFPVVEDYPTPEALAERVREDLLKIIEEDYPEEEVPDALTLERMRHEAYGTARCRLYLGGEKHLKALDEAVAREGEQSRPVLVTGGAGVGKSAMLANWVERYAANHPDTHVLVHHTSASAHAADPLRMVRRLIHEITAVTGDSLEPETDADKLLEQVPTVLAMASAHATKGGKKSGKQGGGQWLIVLDGLDKLTSHGELRWFPRMMPEGVKLVVSCAKEETAGRLRDMLDWEELEVGLFSKERSREFIGTYLGRFRKTLPADLVDRAMTHPLATNPLWLLTLLEELRLFGKHEEVEQRLETLLSDPPGKAEGEEPHIDDLFEHVLARIEEDIDEDYEVEAFKALWASYDGLTRDELLDLTGMPPAKWSEIQNALDENLFEAAGQISFSNGFIRKAVEDRHLSTKEEQQEAHRRLGEWFEGRETSLNVAQERVHQWRQAGDKDKLRECLLEQDVFELLYNEDKLALIGYWVELNEDLEKSYGEVFEVWKDQNNIAAKLAAFLKSAGIYGSFTEALYRRALAAKEMEQGSEHPDTLSSINQLADLLESKGDYYGAEALFRRALAGREKALGPEHADTLASVNELGGVLKTKGDYNGAEILYRRALAGRKKALGQNHSDTLASFDELGDLLGDMGDLEGAEQLFRQVLTIAEHSLGPNHPDTLKAVGALGWFLWGKDDLERAEPLIRRALAGQEKVLGADDMTTRATGLVLGVILQKKGDLEGAEKLIRELMEWNEKNFGPDHPLTLSSTVLFVGILDDKGDFEEAEKLSCRLIRGSEKTYGVNHPDTFFQIKSFAILLWKSGDLEGAEDNYRRALAGYEKTFGPDHPDTLDALSSLGSLLSEKGEPCRAEGFYRKALNGQEKSLGSEHPDTLDTCNSLGELLFEKGELDEAEKLYRRAQEGREETYGLAHSDTVESVDGLGRLLSEKGELAEVEKLYLRVIQDLQKVLEPCHSYLLGFMRSLGFLYRDKDDLKQAEHYFRVALEGYKHSPEEELFSITTISQQLGGILDKSEKREEAMSHFQEALRGYECLPDSDSDVLNCVLNLGLICKNSGKWDEAENHFRRALNGYEKQLGPENDLCTGLVNLLGMVLCEKGDCAGAEAEYRRALAGREKALGREHPGTLGTVYGLGIFLNDQARRPEAVKLLRSYASRSAEAEDTLAYNLACYECLEGNADEAKRLIGEHLKKHPEKKENALKDEDFAAIRDWIRKL